MSSAYLFLIAFVMVFPVSGYGQMGTVTGVVPITASPAPVAGEKYTGSISGTVLPPPERVAGVWLEGDATKNAPPRPASMDQKGYQFISSLLVVQVGARVAFPNRDEDYHNVFSLSKTKRFDLGRYLPTEPAPSVVFDKPGVVRLFCEIHGHMRGTILAVPSPYHATTDAAGRFSLQAPPGKYTLHVWLDEKRKWEKGVTIEAGKVFSVKL